MQLCRKIIWTLMYGKRSRNSKRKINIHIHGRAIYCTGATSTRSPHIIPVDYDKRGARVSGI